MIELKPDTYRAFDCPECKSGEVAVCDTVFQGIHTLAECRCESCGLEFYHEFPVGNARHYPTVFGKNDVRLYEGGKVPWYSRPLLDSFRHRCDEKMTIEKKVYSERKEVVILNCLDFLYGHVLLKLLNAQYYLDHRKDLGLVVIAPKSFAWLVPEGVAELWLVDVKLGKESQQWFAGFENFVRNEVGRFDKVYLSLAFSEPDFSKIDISRFTRVDRFDLPSFYNKEINITFIAREDRLWFASNLEKFVYRVFRRLNLLKYVGKLFLYRQNKRVASVFKKIRGILPDVKFNVTGMNIYGGFGKYVNDVRVDKIDKITENNWCELYAKSHVVIGVHGSNMILPTALSAGFIEILPKGRYGNMVQDIGLPYSDRSLLFLGRFVGEFADPGEIADIAVSIIKDYEGFHLYMGPEHLEHDLYADARRFSGRK